MRLTILTCGDEVLEKDKIKVKDISKNAYNIVLAIGILIVALNFIYFIAFNDPFRNSNTAVGVLIIIGSLFMKEKNKKEEF